MQIRRAGAYVVLAGLFTLGCDSSDDNGGKSDGGDAGRRDSGTIFDTGPADRTVDLPNPADVLETPTDAVTDSLPIDTGQDMIVALDGAADAREDARDVPADTADAPPPRLDAAPDAVDAPRNDAALDVQPGLDAIVDVGVDGALSNTFVATLTGTEVLPMVTTTGSGNATFELSTTGTVPREDAEVTWATARTGCDACVGCGAILPAAPAMRGVAATRRTMTTHPNHDLLGFMVDS